MHPLHFQIYDMHSTALQHDDLSQNNTKFLIIYGDSRATKRDNDSRTQVRERGRAGNEGESTQKRVREQERGTESIELDEN